MSKKQLSTFEREMQQASFREKFEAEYNKFALSETIKTLMESAHKTVRTLAKESGLSPTVIQNLRSGQQEDVKLGNFINISHACGYKVILEKNDERISLLKYGSQIMT
jgi:transcriptional regulator with XRE-family HTH domain